ncbi:MAG: hypothetical protein E6Q98_05855 [Rhodospirillaceae bacterium]|nr:MAG: hypothetical protein E6Q98_05855 [Rhodospirillaceae bacterium]
MADRIMIEEIQLKATSAPRLRVREPGLPFFAPGVKHYRVLGGGAVILSLFAGVPVSIAAKGAIVDNDVLCSVPSILAGGVSLHDFALLGLTVAWASDD